MIGKSRARNSDNNDDLPHQQLFFSRFFLRFSVQDQIVFAKRLSIMIKAGVPILAALGMLEEQSLSKSARRIIGYLRQQVEKGRSLSSGMAEYRQIFGEFAINIIRVGEVSGTLTQNLQYLADELKKKQELKRNITSAMIYPCFIVVATFAIAVLLTAYVFPKILPILQSFKGALPWSTLTLIAVSAFMQNYWFYLVAGIAVFAVVWTLLLKINSFKLFIDRNSLGLPVFGRLFKTYYIANFTRTFGLLLKSDIGIIESLHIVGNTSGNSAYRKKFFEIADHVKRGEEISSLMAKDKFLFPAVITQMLSAGEYTGGLSAVSLYLAEMHEDELNTMTKDLLTTIEPVLMIFMGVVVGFIALSIITPIYGITQVIHP